MKDSYFFVRCFLAVTAVFLSGCEPDSSDKKSAHIDIGVYFADIAKIPRTPKVYVDAALFYDEASQLLKRSNVPSAEDKKKGKNLLIKAAKLGHTKAINKLAELSNTPEAWYALSAKLGDPYGALKVATYQTDARQKIYWATRSALMGNSQAYFELSKALSSIDGIESAFWLVMAVAHLPEGVRLDEAKKTLARLEKNFSSSQMVEIRARAKRFEHFGYPKPSNG